MIVDGFLFSEGSSSFDEILRSDGPISVTSILQEWGNTHESK